MTRIVKIKKAKKVKLGNVSVSKKGNKNRTLVQMMISVYYAYE